MLKHDGKMVFVIAMVFCLVGVMGFSQPPAGPPGRGPGGGMGLGAGPNTFQPGDGPEGPREGEAFARSLGALKHFLELTDEQVEEILSIVRSTREAAHDLRQQVRPLEEELAALLNGDNPDATAVGTLVLQIHDLRSQIGDLWAAQREAIEAVLTPEQLEKLERVRNLFRLEALFPALRGLGLIGPGPFGHGHGPGNDQ